MPDYDLIVIGSGAGGLNAAMMAAAAGSKVLVLEHSNEVGGCSSSFYTKGYVCDTGASILEVLYCFDEPFAAAGRNMYDYVKLLSCEPAFRIMFDDGKDWIIPAAEDKFIEMLEKNAPEDVEGWKRYAKVMRPMERSRILFQPMGTWWEVLKAIWADRSSGASLDSLQILTSSYGQIVDRYFKNPKMKQVMSFASWYVGLPPDRNPGVFAGIPYGERQGIYYPLGGMVSLPAAWQRVIEEEGGEIRLHSTVTKVLIESGRAIGVRLADGTEIRASAVLSNTHPLDTYARLVGPDHLPSKFLRRIKDQKISMATVMAWFGVKGESGMQTMHEIRSLPVDLQVKWWEETMVGGKMPDRLTYLLYDSTMKDPLLSPPGTSLISFVAGAPFKVDGGPWYKLKEQYLEKIIDTLEADGYDIRDRLTYADIGTPQTFKKWIRLEEGAVYALDPSWKQLGPLRNNTRSPVVKNLYLAGAGTHVGGGVPTSSASGYVAAINYCKDHGFSEGLYRGRPRPVKPRYLPERITGFPMEWDKRLEAERTGVPVRHHGIDRDEMLAKAREMVAVGAS